LREVRERGLLAKVWINNSGPFTFAVDTGAGISLISRRVAVESNLAQNGTQESIGGISGRNSNTASNTIVRSMAIGDSANFLNGNQRALIVDNLPRDLDGVLDPTAAYFPLGYSIDLPNRRLDSFDPKTQPLRAGAVPEGGTVVRWVNNDGGRRPFVRLGDGRIALIDTGSGFGLAVTNPPEVSQHATRQPVVHDIGGGYVSSQRIAPQTVSIGDLTLRKVPTDLLSGAERDAPILIGRDALYPFRLTFDPIQRLIEIAPARRF
jgi:hypothetical protein